MYIGDSSVQGLHHLVYELVNNSIDEVMASFATLITVTINNDGSVSVEDDGRGIPVEKHEQTSEQKGRDVSTLEAYTDWIFLCGIATCRNKWYSADRCLVFSSGTTSHNPAEFPSFFGAI